MFHLVLLLHLTGWNVIIHQSAVIIFIMCPSLTNHFKDTLPQVKFLMLSGNALYRSNFGLKNVFYRDDHSNV